MPALFQNIYPAVLADCFPHQPLHLRLFRDVRFDKQGPPAGLADHFPCGSAVADGPFPDITDDNTGAGPGKGKGRRPSDTRRSPCDQGHFFCQAAFASWDRRHTI